jgi:hypothetical protein
MCIGYQWLDCLAQPLSDCNNIVEYRPLECHPLLELLAAPNRIPYVTMTYFA